MMLGLMLLLAVALLASLGLAIRSILASKTALPVTTEWLDELSPERYRPILRLLAEGEMDFLDSQPGFTPGMLAAVRRHRAEAIRDRLQAMSCDFSLVCAALKLIMLQSQVDRPELALALLRSQITFAGNMLLAHGRLWLYRVGLGSVDVSALIVLFGSMTATLKTVAPAAIRA